MPTAYKSLAAYQSPNSPVWVDLYTVPANTTTVVSSIVVSNPISVGAKMGIRLVKASNATTVTLVPLPASTANLAAETRVAFTEGWTLSAGDKIQIQGTTGSGGIDWSLFGSEIS